MGVCELTALETLDKVLALLFAADADALLLTRVGSLVVSLRSGLLSLFDGLGATTTKEHVGKTVTDRRSNSDTGSGGSHLSKQTGSLRLLCHGRRVLLSVGGLLVVMLLRRRSHGVCAARAGGRRARRTGRST